MHLLLGTRCENCFVFTFFWRSSLLNCEDLVSYTCFIATILFSFSFLQYICTYKIFMFSFFSASKFFHSPENSASAFRTLLGEKFLIFIDPTQHLLMHISGGNYIKGNFFSYHLHLFRKKFMDFLPTSLTYSKYIFLEAENFLEKWSKEMNGKKLPIPCSEKLAKKCVYGLVKALLLKIICLYQTGITLWPKSYSQITILIFILP